MQDYTQIKTFEDAYRLLGLIPVNILHYTDTADEAAYKKLKVIVRALNQIAGANSSALKGVVYWAAYEGEGIAPTMIVPSTSHQVPISLHLQCYGAARYCATQFADLWRDYFCINQ